MDYLVDCENVGIDKWIFTINIKPNDRIFLFVNNEMASRTISLSTLAKLIQFPSSRLSIERCHSGKNSMDLCIAAKCGELFNKERSTKRKYVIVSNDTGYDGFIKTCAESGHDIHRLAIDLNAAVPTTHSENPPLLDSPAETDIATKPSRPSDWQLRKKVRKVCVDNGIGEKTTNKLIDAIVNKQRGIHDTETKCLNILTKKYPQKSEILFPVFQQIIMEVYS